MEAKKDRIKVLWLTTSTAGGTGLHAYYIAKHLSRDRFDLTLAFGPGYPMDEQIATLGVPIVHFSLSRRLSPLKNLRGLIQLYRYLRKNSFDIVCIGNAIAGFTGRVAAWLARVPVRVFVLHSFASHPHQSWIKRTVFRAIERAMDPLTTRYVAVADVMRRFGVAHGIMKSDKVDVIYNGIDLPEKISTSPETIRSELGLKPDSVVVGTLARFETQKGLEYLNRAAEIVRGQSSNVEFLIVGDGPLKDDLLAQVRQLGIEDMVCFVGWRTDVPELLACMDVFCMPSLWEAMPFTLIEAMAAERPIVATNIDGIPEVVIDGATGLLVPPENPSLLSEAILKLAEDPELRRHMGLAARQRVEAEFTVAKMIQRYENLISSLVCREKTCGCNEVIEA